MNIFILEDADYRIRAFKEELFYHTITLVTNVEQAKKEWRPPYDLLLLDHDLGGEIMVPEDMENTGSGFVRWLQDLYKDCHPDGLPVPKAFVHSFNFGAADNMVSKLQDMGIDASAFPYGTTLLGVVKNMEATPENEQPSRIIHPDGWF